MNEYDWERKEQMNMIEREGMNGRMTITAGANDKRNIQCLRIHLTGFGATIARSSLSDCTMQKATHLIG